MAGYIHVVEPESCTIPVAPGGWKMMEEDIEKDVDVVASALQITLEYNRQSVMKRLKQLDKATSKEELSEDVKNMLLQAGEIMQALSSKSIRNNELLYAEKKVMLSKSATEKAFLRLEMYPLLKKEERVNTRVAELQQDLQLAKQQCKELQEQHEKKMAEQELEMLKTEEQKKTLQDLKGYIQSVAITDLMASEELQHKLDYMRQMRGECAALRAEIDQYRALPPNTAKAEAVFMRTKQEYDQLCQTINSLVHGKKKLKTGRKP